MSKKTLTVYGTRFGATASASEEIAGVLRDEGIDVKVVDAKKEKIDDISGYDLIIIGSGIMINRWTGEPERLIKKFQKELAHKKVALFVSSGGQAIIEYEGKVEDFHFGRKTTTLTSAKAVGRAQKIYLEEKALNYNLKPIALRVFGGIWDYHRIPWWSRKAMEAAKLKLEAAGYKEIKPGVYDTRDLKTILEWAKELAITILISP